MIGDDAHHGRNVCVVHGGGVESGIARPVLALGNDDFGGTHSLGHQSDLKVGGEIMNLLSGPFARFIGGNIRVRLVLDGDGVEIDAIGDFHTVHVVGKLAGIVQIGDIRSASEIIATVL